MGKRKLAHEEFVEKVLQKNKYYANNGFDIIGEYVNYHTPIECYCSKHDLHWSPTPASLCDGWGCPSCGTESTANHKRLTHEDFIKKLSQSNQYYVNGDITIKGLYTGSNRPIDCHCNIHDVDWSPIPSNLYRGCGCPECGKEAKSIRKLKPFKDGVLKESTKTSTKMKELSFSATNRALKHEKFLKKLLLKNQHYANGDFIIKGKYAKSDEPIECYCNIHNISWHPIPINLYQGCGCPECGKEVVSKKISLIMKDNSNNALCRTLTHEEFLERLEQKNQHYVNGDFNVIGQYKGMYEPIECYCNIHNITWYPQPINLCKGSGCHYCWGKRTIVGYNDMWTTRPDIASMLQNPEDGYKYTFSSNEKTWFNCPDCGIPSLKKICNVSHHNFGCQHCSDSVSYPNKFGRALLDQLPVNEYDYEYQPDWAKPYYYDNHFCYNGIEYILEMDGDFHFKEQQLSRNTLEQVQMRDRLKDELAFNHGIHMIRIECIKSEMDYIRANILKSELNSIFDLSNIDWDLCDQKAQKNILKEACELYMSNSYTLKEIGKILQVHPATVSKYLQKGRKFGWSDYAPLKSKAVVVIDDNGQIRHSFNSMAECKREMKRLYNITFSSEYLRKAIESHEPYHGFNFRFASEFNNNN